MSQENVETFKRTVEAINCRDIDAVTEGLDPEVEWHTVLHSELTGEPVVYWGHPGVREWLRDLHEDFAETNAEYPDIRDLGDRVVAIGHVRARGRASGAEVESPFGALVEFRNGKATRLLTYLDPKDALEAAGLSE